VYRILPMMVICTCIFSCAITVHITPHLSFNYNIFNMGSTQNLRGHPAFTIDILIVGGGIAGLAAAFCLGRYGHRITVIEQNTLLEDAGAGIQLTPSKLYFYSLMDYAFNICFSNSDVSRLLIRWGLQASLDKVAVRPVSASFNRCERCVFMQQ
jgi:hypothetical protein